mgnify:CR=1 FL=1
MGSEKKNIYPSFTPLHSRARTITRRAALQIFFRALVRRTSTRAGQGRCLARLQFELLFLRRQQNGRRVAPRERQQRKQQEQQRQQQQQQQQRVQGFS